MMLPRLSPWAWLYATLLFQGHSATARPQGGNKAPTEPVVDTSFGRVQGSFVSSTVAAYRGIPYAQPPIGDLRFQPPRAIKKQSDEESNTTIDATQYGYRCIQYPLDLVFPVPLDAAQENEDCLTVNVFVPTKSAADKEKKLPVLVWIYGGAWLEGYASGYDPTSIVEQFPDMIVVTFNYRLSIFGFPQSAAIDRGATNPGLRDQRLAISWVRDNIRAFNGDPSRIVVGGHSAGSASIVSYLYAYPDDPIVTGAFLMSGPATLIGPRNSREFERVATAVGCRDAKNAKGELACMKKVDAGRLRSTISPSTRNTLGSSWEGPNGGVPGHDEETAFSPESLARRAQDGKFAKVPVVIGDVENEYDGLMPWTPRGINHTASDLLTLNIFHCPDAAEARTRSRYSAPTWRFRFQAVFPSFRIFPWIRSFHGQDVILLFFGHLYPEPERSAATYLRSALAAFVTDPNRGLVRFGWPVYKPDASSTLIDLFQNNTIQPAARFSDPRLRDRACEHPPPPLLAALNIDPPPCDPCFD